MTVSDPRGSWGRKKGKYFDLNIVHVVNVDRLDLCGVEGMVG